MTAYLVFGAATAAFIVLALWEPREGVFAGVFRNYCVVLIGALLAVFALAWVIKRLGHPELALGDGLFFAVAGAGTAVGAAVRFRPYWEVASLWPLFRELPERTRQGVLTLLGLAILGLGLSRMAEAHSALQDCHHQYDVAVTTHDSLNVLRLVPAPTLRAYRGAPPFTCGDLLELQ